MDKNYVVSCRNFASDLARMARWIEEGHNLDEVRKFHYDYEHDLIKYPLAENDCPIYSEKEIVDAIRIVKENLLVNDERWGKVTTLINEWNASVVPILTGVVCNSFEEFAMQVANVAGQCIKYKSAKEAMPQPPVQPQQNQMFVDVNTLVSENTYLKSLNASKDEEIKSLRERLVALGQPV